MWRLTGITSNAQRWTLLLLLGFSGSTFGHAAQMPWWRIRILITSLEIEKKMPGLMSKHFCSLLTWGEKKIVQAKNSQPPLPPPSLPITFPTVREQCPLELMLSLNYNPLVQAMHFGVHDIFIYCKLLLLTIILASFLTFYLQCTYILLKY